MEITEQDITTPDGKSPDEVKRQSREAKEDSVKYELYIRYTIYYTFSTYVVKT